MTVNKRGIDLPENKVGLLVNPIAGMGGKVGLKGTDGPEILKKARELGSEPVAPERAIKALKKLKDSGVEPEILCFSDEMGANEAREVGFEPRVLEEINPSDTSPEDTKSAMSRFLEEGVDIILFAGGDGTARDVVEIVNMDVPILGIPTGVKMHSAVFANTPEIAGRLVSRYLMGNLPLREAEVMDVDEEAFRENRLSTDLKGYAKVPYDPHWVQAAKSPTPSSGSEKEDQKSIARWVTELMDDNRLYLLGPGTTTRAVAEELGISDSTLLGIDLIKNGKLIAKDVRENEIYEKVEEEGATTIIVSPIGKQGFVFGRGNQQISPRVIKAVGIDNLLVLATPNKLVETSMLKVDTGDPELDDRLRGYARVIVGYRKKRPAPVS